MKDLHKLESELIARTLDKTLDTRNCLGCGTVQHVTDGRYDPHIISRIVDGQQAATTICAYSLAYTRQKIDEIIDEDMALLREIRDLLKKNGSD